MPINDTSVLFAADKPTTTATTTSSSSTLATAAAAPKCTTPPTAAAAAATHKPGAQQLELHLTNAGSVSMSMSSSSSSSASSSSSSSASPTKFSDNVLFQRQGQNWQQYFDFDRMLKQIRQCEMQHSLRGSSDSGHLDDTAAGTSDNGATSNNSNGKNLPSSPSKSSSSTAASSSSSHSPARSPSSSDDGGRNNQRHLRQVKRLNACDMHYYGIVPKQTAIGVIVCSVCMRIYTKMGFSNHMMIHHPTIWNSVSSKVYVASGGSGDAACSSLHGHDNSQDGMRDAPVAVVVAPSELLGSPSDLSGTASTCSNASSTSSMSSTYVAKHKSSSKNGSLTGSSSSSGGGGGGGRSRSKSKHHHSSSSSASADASHASSNKSSKKSVGAVVATTAANALNSAKDSTTSNSHIGTKPIPDSMQSLAVYSSSSASNSSCSLPPTPRVIADGGTALSAARDDGAAYSPATECSSSGGSTGKEKQPTEATAAPKQQQQQVTTYISGSAAKKKAHSPSFLGQETVDSSSSSSDFDHTAATAGVKASAPSSAGKQAAYAGCAAKVDKDSGHRSGKGKGKILVAATVIKKPPICEKDLKMYNNNNSSGSGSTHISELDRAVSSITGEVVMVLPSPPAPSAPADDKSQQSTSTPQAAATTNANVALLGHAADAAGIVQAGEQATIPHNNSSDDNSILTLEDMLDSKFIHEILNTADAEMHFDEADLESTASQQQQQQQQQTQPQSQLYNMPQRLQHQSPARKRMRYEEPITVAQLQQPTGDYAIYQQQQYARYDNNNGVDDVKLYNAEEQQPQQQQQEAQYQTQLGKLLQQHADHQITTIDAMQLQQLLYQQQQHNYNDDSGAKQQLDHEQQQQQFGDAGMLDTKQIIDFSAEEDVGGGVMAKGGEVYASGGQQSVSCASHFQVFNVPSLIDDYDGDNNSNSAADADAAAVSNTVDVLMPGMVDVSLSPNEEQPHLIYEITANNQVAVLSQQRQQQMLADFLKQANYDGVATTLDANGQQQQPAMEAGAAAAESEAAEFDPDFAHIETVKNPTATTATTDSKASSSNGDSLNSNHQNQIQDDYYLNVFIYAGIPKPLAVNNFGLMKLPQAAATTFRKSLLTTRKANNSPITLNSSLNGMAGSGGTGSSAGMRLGAAASGGGGGGGAGGGGGCATSGKSTSGYFTALSSGNSNEFSIGSITISNTPTQQQSNCGAELSLNASSPTATSPATTAPVTPQHKSRMKAGNAGVGVTAAANQSGSPSGKGKTVATPTATAATGATAAPMNLPRVTARQNSTAQPQQPKTILISYVPGAAANERVKCIRRSLIARADAASQPPLTALLPKHIVETLNAGDMAPIKQQQPQSQHAAPTPPATASAAAPAANTMDGSAEDEVAACQEKQQQKVVQQQLIQTRIKHFFEHRKKLADFARKKPKQESLLLSKHLRPRPSSDTGSGANAINGNGNGNGNSAVNGTGIGLKLKGNNSINNNNSSGNNGPNSGSNNDNVRVFV